MESILEWGVRIIVWFQQFSPTLDLPFLALTFLGNEPFFLLLLPILYWCVDRRVGGRLIVLFLLSSCVNAVAKEIAAQPRPFQYDPVVKPLCKAGGGGLPSGHTQSALVIWGYLASQFRRAWLWVLAGLLVILIPLSRVYLGVHFPTDLLGGYLLGFVLLIVYLRLEPAVEAWLSAKGTPWQLGTALVLPSLLLLFSEIGGSYYVKSAATLLGMGIGFALEQRWVGFDSGGPWWKRGLRLLVGMGILYLLGKGLVVLFSGMGPGFPFRFVRYMSLGLGGALIAPWLFVSVGLAEKRQAKDLVTSRLNRKNEVEPH